LISHAQSDTTLGDMSVVSLLESSPPAPVSNVRAAHYTVRNTFIHYDTCESDDAEDEDPTAIVMGKTKSNILDGTPSWQLGEASPLSRPLMLQAEWAGPPVPMNDGLTTKFGDVDYKVKNTFIHYDNSDLDSEDDEDSPPMLMGRTKSNTLDGKLMSPKKRGVIGIVATSVDDVPSVGSVGHAVGNCKPCAWYWKPGSCVNGSDCGHCHACDAGALKRRKKNRADRLRKQE